MLSAITRGVALFLGIFTVVNVLGDLRFARANSNVWWLDLWPVPLPIERIILVALAAALITCALSPTAARRTRRAGRALLWLAAAAAGVSAVRFYVALARQTIQTSFPMPLSLVVAATLVAIALSYGNERRDRPLAIAAAAIAAAAIFPLLQVLFFGSPDVYRHWVGLRL